MLHEKTDIWQMSVWSAQIRHGERLFFKKAVFPTLFLALQIRPQNVTHKPGYRPESGIPDPHPPFLGALGAENHAFRENAILYDMCNPQIAVDSLCNRCVPGVFWRGYGGRFFFA